LRIGGQALNRNPPGIKTMTEFTPVSALIGGALIGLSAAMLMLFTGRIAGISGIFGGCMTAPANDRNWRLAFVAGLIVAPLVTALVDLPLTLPRMPANWGVVIAAGLLVGFGSRLGSGCTSGHGICGIARLSPRSIAATAIFMATAMIVVFVMRHVIGG
jgi:uncharacterized membrane protein YedE/YeeE